ELELDALQHRNLELTPVIRLADAVELDHRSTAPAALARHASSQPASSPAVACACCLSAMRLRRLSGRMSVQTSLMYSRHSAFGPLLPASFQPSGLSL